MMRTRFIYMILIMTMLPFLSKGQTFQKVYFNNDYARYTTLSSVLRRPDGTILGTIYNKEYTEYNYAAGIACFQSDGTPLWVLGDGNKHLFFGEMFLLPDNGFITTSNRHISTQVFDEGIISRFDASGNMLWNRQLPLINNNIANNLSIAGQNSIFLVGNTAKSVYVSKINESGTANWEKEILIDSTQGVTSTVLENGNLLFGYKSDIKSDHDGHLVEVNPGGDLIQSMKFSDRTIGQIRGLNNGNIIMVSQSNRLDSLGDTWFSLLDPQLRPLWTQKIEIPGWNINNIIVSPNRQQDSLTVLFNNSYNAELGILTVGLDGVLHTVKARFGTWVDQVIRMPDDGLLLAGGEPFESFKRSVLVKMDAAYHVEGCPSVPLCNVSYTAENLPFAPDNIVLKPTIQLHPIQLAVQKTNWQSMDYCGDPPDTVALFKSLDSTICAGSKTKFLAVSVGNGVWTFENGVPDYQNSGRVGATQFDAPGQYTVTHTTTQGGCYKETATQLIQVLAQPNLELDAEHKTCIGDSILVAPKIIATDLQYKWNDGLTTPERFLDQAGIYILEAINSKGCKRRDTTLLNIITLPVVQIDGKMEACKGQDIELKAVTDRPGLTFLWNTGLENAELSVQTPGLYTVQVSDGPCMSEDSMRVFFNECCVLFVPNAFAPGSGGDNDRWGVKSNCGFMLYHVQIFDRWGSLVFESSTPGSDWDGMYNGKVLPLGVYICRMELETENGDKRSRVQRFEQVTIVR